MTNNKVQQYIQQKIWMFWDRSRFSQTTHAFQLKVVEQLRGEELDWSTFAGPWNQLEGLTL